MKLRVLLSVGGLALCAWLAAPNPLFAQGTAFTYQGRLLLNGAAASGNYDMKFLLLTQLGATNQVGPTLTNAPVGVTNGLFLVTLDFSNVFGTSPLYLEIGVRTNGSTNAYNILSPPQLLTSAPYAVQALNAASATAYAGAIADSQLSTNIAQLDGSPTFGGVVTFSNATGAFNGTLSGTFSGAATGTFSGGATGTFSGASTGTFTGNGAALTNLNVTNLVGVVQSNPNWQLIQSSPQQAVVANNYLTTNAAQTTLILPASPGVGSTVYMAGSGANGWIISQNSGQSILTAPLGLPAGQLWTSQYTTHAWRAVASSANGLKLFAAAGSGSGDGIYTSSDGGNTWTATSASTSQNWYGIACSADGTHVVAVPYGGYPYTSVDGGSNWTQQTGGFSTLGYFHAVASSADGIKLVAVIGTGYIWTSSNGGTNWTQRGLSENWTCVASSADGTMLTAAYGGGSGYIYTSPDSGVTWTQQTNGYGSALNWTGLASSADGNHIVASVNNGNLYTSGDAGVTWTPRATSQSWTCVTSSSNGMSLAAAYGGGTGYIYTSSDSGQTWLQRTNGYSSAMNWTAITSSASGSRLLAAVATSGLLYTSLAATTIGSGTLAGTQFSNIQLQYVGNGVWMPLNFSGGFTGN